MSETLTSPSGRPMRVLALCDSPAGRPEGHLTGFGRVAKNLFTEWSKQGVQIDVWAIHFSGWGYHEVPWKLFPAGGNDWNTPRRLEAFLNQLATGGYTHCWILMDADALCVGNFPEQFRLCCQRYNIQSTLYFPIDARQEREWLEFAKVVDVPITYTSYGVAEVRKFDGKLANRMKIVPHGLDANFQFTESDRRAKARSEFRFGDASFVRPGDFLILNVNKNEWRKDPLRSLEILKGLHRLGIRAKLVLRMAPRSGVGGVDLERAARQLGLDLGKDWVCAGAIPENQMVDLYAMADLYLTTTLGEGWGLGITEALGAGTPVAMPEHTSCGEIGERVIGLSAGSSPHIVWLDTEPGFVCGTDTRLRNRVDLVKAVESIADFYRSGHATKRIPLDPAVRHWLSWERVAGEMLKWMRA